MHSLPLVAFVAGIFGTAATHLFLFLLARTRLVESRLPEKLGSVALRRLSGVSHVGILIHYVFGTLFGLIYANLVLLADPESSAEVFVFCMLLGAVHGLLAGLGLLRFAKHHPLHEFREAPVSVAMAYGCAHLVYAAVVATAIVMLGSF